MDPVFPRAPTLATPRFFEVPNDLNGGATQCRSPCTVKKVTPPPDPNVIATIRRRIEYGAACRSSSNNSLASEETEGRAHRLASLQSALSILCHIAATDSSKYFVHPQLRVGRATDAGGNDSTLPYTVTEIYTTVCALKLEYEDILSQLRKECETQPSDSESLRTALSETERRVDDCVYLLELTVLQMFLNIGRARQVPAVYVEQMLCALPGIFSTEKWPCRTIIMEDTQRRSERQDASMDAIGCEGECSDDVTHATTAIAFKTLHEVKNSDCLHLLCNQNKRQIGSGLFVPLNELLGRALKGEYRTRGLYAVLYDVKQLLYAAYASIPVEYEAVLHSLHQQFEQSVRRHYGNFLRSSGLSHDAESDDLLLPVKTIFDLNPLPIPISENSADVFAYSDTQVKCMQLLGKLREVDTNRWFEYPAFDMANVELSTLERWIRGPSFGKKSDREAFTALRNILEKMVDSCVMSYGPDSPYSRVITLIRHRLVDAARALRLL
uniref:Uncharacterized protein n=1 Tax=Trypanosoma vivax (strain Y486) TaxID=1055687 RepID=G0TUB9_TRYVY|nr:conserved hypothetical protein [Trypanosoma vivax Y486]